MKSFSITVTILSLVSFLFVGIVWVTGDSTIYADVTCSSTHCNAISPSGGSEVWESQVPGEPTANANGQFQTTTDLEFAWCWESVTLNSSSWAWMEWNDVGGDNVDTVAFNPQNWLMTNFGGCDGTKSVDISGQLHDRCEEGTVLYEGHGFANTGVFDAFANNLIVNAYQGPGC
jgi:hypothetical protein